MAKCGMVEGPVWHNDRSLDYVDAGLQI
jgi:sugar lactone lactonase YvrE